MSCSTNVNAPAFDGPPDQLSGGEVCGPAHVNSVGSVSPSLNALLVSVKPGVAVPLRIICGIATGLPAASGLADGLAAGLPAGLAAGFAAAEGLAAADAAGLAPTDGAGLVAGLFAAGAVVAAGAAVGVEGALLHATRNAAQTPPRVANKRCIVSGFLNLPPLPYQTASLQCVLHCHAPEVISPGSSILQRRRRVRLKP